MSGVVLLDTGPLVAGIDRRDHLHAWAVHQLDTFRPPLMTCEAVISEACFLLRKVSGGPQAVMKLLHLGIVVPLFSLANEIEPAAQLLERYADVPMSLADACLVRMAELHSGSMVLTTDRDFLFYRKHRRQTIRTLMPAKPPPK